jgi:glutathione S-transferase
MSAGTLYTSPGSGNSYKIRLLAGILGIDLKHEEISLKVRFFFSLPCRLILVAQCQ